MKPAPVILKVLLFPPITRRMAQDIARQALAQSVASEPLICHGRRPTRFSIYADLPEPCWWVQAPWNDSEANVIRSSRVIVIGRETGRISLSLARYNTGAPAWL